MRILDACVLVLIAGIAVRGAAQVSQAPSASAPAGVVMGHVFCGDTHRLGRFAEVALLRKSEEAAHPATAEPGASANQSAPVSAAPQVVFASTRSLLDGSFTISHVPPGDYFVVAKMDGYIVPIVTVPGQQDAGAADASPRRVSVDAPVAHVAANQIARVDVTMRRGGAISGKVQFDDGTPVVQASVQVEPAKWEDADVDPILSQQLSVLAGGRHQATTDDEGRYRIAGLVPGKYQVRTTVNFGQGKWLVSYGNSQYSDRGPSGVGSELRLYQPGTFRRSEAKVFEIKGDEEDVGADIDVPVDGLHAVEGRVLAKSDGHAPNFAGVTVSMDHEIGGMTYTSEDGSFRVEYLPKGTYTVRIQAMDYDRSSGQSGTPKVIRQYEWMTTTVVVGEQDVVMDDMLVVEAKPKQ